MKTKEYRAIIEEILKKDNRLWDKEKKEFSRPYLFYLIDKNDERLIELLYESKEIREKFFTKVKDAYVFKSNEFKFFIEEHKVFNSFTSYANRIGLYDGKKIHNGQKGCSNKLSL